MKKSKALCIVTTERAPWKRGSRPIPIRSKATRARRVDLALTGKETGIWRGFGGCFNELGWRALNHLPAAKREEILDRFFLPRGDFGFEFCRLPIGANDYAEDWYSHNETPDDFSMEYFSIARDRKALIPYISAALRRRSDLTLFASPWSPPTWFKDPPVYNYGRLRLEKKYLDAYALYFVRFVQAYAAEGIPIHQIHVQNEPVSNQKFPSCVITGRELALFIGQHLGPAFQRAGLETEIWLGTLNGPPSDDRKFWSGFNDYAFTVLEDPKARPYVRGISYQWDGKQVLWRTRLAYPDLPIIQSENECGDGQNSWEYAWYVTDLVHHYIAQGVVAYVYWNLVLETGGESTWGWRQNSLMTVDPKTQKVTVNPEYYILRHYAAFIHRGDRALRCACPWAANTVAFRTSQGIVAVIRNPFPEARTLTIDVEGEPWKATLPACSLSTLIFPQATS